MGRKQYTVENACKIIILSKLSCSRIRLEAKIFGHFILLHRLLLGIFHTNLRLPVYLLHFCTASPAILLWSGYVENSKLVKQVLLAGHMSKHLDSMSPKSKRLADQ